MEVMSISPKVELGHLCLMSGNPGSVTFITLMELDMLALIMLVMLGCLWLSEQH